MVEGTRAARPLSPHLQIWRFTATMASSITHRATGMALYAGAILLAAWFFAAALGPDAFAPVAMLVGSWFGKLVLFGFAWSLLFHAMTGVRHLYWDAGRGLAPKTAILTSWLIYGASLALTVLLFILAGGGAA